MRRYFIFLHLKFDVLKARELAASYPIEKRQPDSEWLSPFFIARPKEIAKADLSATAIFVSIPQNGKLCDLLIDGNEVVQRALDSGVSFLNTVTLNTKDSLDILCSKKDVREAIIQESHSLGLIDADGNKAKDSGDSPKDS